MTVKELIEKLQKLENKDGRILFEDAEWGLIAPEEILQHENGDVELINGDWA